MFQPALYFNHAISIWLVITVNISSSKLLLNLGCPDLLVHTYWALDLHAHGFPKLIVAPGKKPIHDSKELLIFYLTLRGPVITLGFSSLII